MFNLKVTLDRLEIINKLQANKEKHQAEYSDASREYKKQKVAKLEEALYEAERHVAGNADDVNITMNMGLSKPIDNSGKYDELINAFRMIKGEFLELDFEDAKNIANDSFHWLETSKLINSMYSNAR